MSTFDTIVPVLQECLEAVPPSSGTSFLVNRDLNGRVRLIVPAEVERDDARRGWFEALSRRLSERLGPHAPLSQGGLLFEDDLEAVCADAPRFPLEKFPQVRVVDRLIAEGGWATLAPSSPRVPRVAFSSIKGGVGRSTALAAAAWALADAGRRVLVLDLDLESPGLSSSLLPEDRRPPFGLVDWLVEDLVDNGAAVFDGLTASSPLATNGEIRVVPAHGREPGEYVAKLGRVWMARRAPGQAPEPWTRRLARLIDALEDTWQPDLVLLDARAGLDDIAAACVTDLGAELVLLFASDSAQTWQGYRVLFELWQRHGIARDMRKRLQLVGAMVPDDERRGEVIDGLREHGHDVFEELMYDSLSPDDDGAEAFAFARDDETAPHAPWVIRWNRGFSTLSSLHGRLREIDRDTVHLIFGPLVEGIASLVETGNTP
ncbi:ParA family protein [Pararhodospirillum oryzae]|uniref:CobQ/CobB/MinD/ParA nucleotide binding domain-containing protein n=1 Tax=Pararhodospirillum oryzae TaxID=478448 RepID=A0A512H9I7_9PROT|nr:cellulose synthase operon protein YhjQ/BcsQ [Pararhodospirillum oryzae]GEO82113.1 hypothetical protein ROR02_22440 [Pararhodospirillum oryzae]